MYIGRGLLLFLSRHCCTSRVRRERLREREDLVRVDARTAAVIFVPYKRALVHSLSNQLCTNRPSVGEGESKRGGGGQCVHGAWLVPYTSPNTRT